MWVRLCAEELMVQTQCNKTVLCNCSNNTKKVNSALMSKQAQNLFSRDYVQALSGSGNDVALQDRSRAPWVEPRWNTRRWKGKWWFVIKTFQRKANAKGPIYACYNFTQSLPHAPKHIPLPGIQRTPHKLHLRGACDWVQKYQNAWNVFVRLL